MERGPLALFGAIVAVGVGPALWLGAQLGAVNLAPNERPSTVGEQFPDNDTGTQLDFGGTGAGQTPENADPITRYTPPAVSKTGRPLTDPVGSRPSLKPSSASPSASPSASASASVPASPSTGGSSSPPVDPDPPTEPEPESSSSPPAGDQEPLQ